MNQVTCPKCNRPNRQGVKFCAGCGTPLPISPQPPPPQPSPPQPPLPQHSPPQSIEREMPTTTVDAQRHKIWMWVGAGIVLLIIIVATGLMLFNNDGDDSAVAEDVPPTAEATEEPEDNPPTEIPPTNQPTAPTPETETASPTPSLIATPTVTITPPTTITMSNLLINGNFELPWDDGWERIITEGNGPQTTEIIEIPESSIGRALNVEHNGNGAVQIEQEQSILVNPAQMTFSGEIQLINYIGENNEGFVGLMLVYRDTNGIPLGYSIWLNENQRNSQLFGTSPLPPLGSNVSIHPVSSEWQKIEQDLRTEVINSLVTVQVDTIHEISVMLVGIGSEGCPPDSCFITMKAANLVLTSGQP